MSDDNLDVQADDSQKQAEARNASQDAAAMRNFMLLYGGQILSLLGTTLSGFAVGVWVFQQTGSVMDFALIGFFTLIPVVLISPIAGVIADRWDRKIMLIVTDAVAACLSLWVVYLFWTDQLAIWHLYVMAIGSGLANGLQRPVYESTMPLIVPKHLLGNANGILQTGAGIAQLLSPVLAGVMLAQFGLLPVLAIDLITFVIAVSGVVLSKIPSLNRTGEKISWWRDMSTGWVYLSARSGLMALILVSMVRNFFFGVVQAVALPMMLIITTAEIGGLLMSVGGLGIILGGAFVGITGGLTPRIRGVLLAQLVTGIALIVVGATTNLFLIGLGVVLIFTALPIEESSSMVILQTKVSPEILGRVQSVRQFLTTLAMPLAFLVAAPLADGIFEPLMAADGALALNVGQIIGTGPGRGMALMMIIFGLITVITTVIAYFYRPLRNVEADLPDMISEEEAMAINNPTQEVSHAAA